MSFDLTSRVNLSPPIDTSAPYSPSTLSGANILITGAANGLGALMVHHWASHGANILIADIDSAAGTSLVATLRQKYPSSTFLYHTCDVTSWESQVSTFEAAIAGLPGGVLDIVVPNAGVLLNDANAAFESPTLGKDGKLPKPNTLLFDVNITGVWYTTHLALYHLPQNPSPTAGNCILLLGSLASIMNFAGQSQYTTSKHAVLGLFRTLRGTASLQHNIRVNMICPYYVQGAGLLNKVSESLLLAGGVPENGTSAHDVIDAATRLIADQSIRGRGLAIGPRLKDVPKEFSEASEAVLPAVTKEEYERGGRAVWEIYADDYKQVDTFVWRLVGLINAGTVARGYFRWFKDMFWIWTRK